MPRADRLRRGAVRLASTIEQEIRAHPRLYNAFYQGIGRSPALRRVVGRAKDGVRQGNGPCQVAADPTDAPLVQARREAAAATRLGLSE